MSHNVLQLSLCGQTPDTALNSALASVKFYIQQQELDTSLRQSNLQSKMERVQEACKRKLQVRRRRIPHSAQLSHSMAAQEMLSNVSFSALQKKPRSDVSAVSAGGAQRLPISEWRLHAHHWHSCFLRCPPVALVCTFSGVQAKRKYQEMLEARNMLEADNEELKLKYQSKAQ